VSYHITLHDITKYFNDIPNFNNYEIKELIKKCDYLSQNTAEYFLDIVDGK
jgi:hypothetical protein